MKRSENGKNIVAHPVAELRSVILWLIFIIIYCVGGLVIGGVLIKEGYILSGIAEIIVLAALAKPIYRGIQREDPYIG